MAYSINHWRYINNKQNKQREAFLSLVEFDVSLNEREKLAKKQQYFVKVRNSILQCLVWTLHSADDV